jgi:hypothetical protein
MTAPMFDHEGFVDMSTFDATDPDLAVAPAVLDQLRHALVTAPVPMIADEEWDAALQRAVTAGAVDVAGDAAEPANELDGPSDDLVVDGFTLDDLVPRPYDGDGDADDARPMDLASPSEPWDGVGHAWRDEHPFGDDAGDAGHEGHAPFADPDLPDHDEQG